jgi:2-C-methyl-D-erythritol 4-phosphate cytidylyltransferase
MGARARRWPRDGLWQAQTPQMFRHRLLLDALDFAPQVTDEASAIEALGPDAQLVAADISNLKVTYPFRICSCGVDTAQPPGRMHSRSAHG